MPKENLKDLTNFLIPFPTYIKELTLWLREFLWDSFPDCNELIYDNYNALAIGFALSDKAGDAFCSIAVYGKHINFGFNRGSEIADPDKILNGKGRLYRYITLRDKQELPKAYIKNCWKKPMPILLQG